MTTATLTARPRSTCSRSQRALCPFRRFVALRAAGRRQIAEVFRRKDAPISGSQQAR